MKEFMDHNNLMKIMITQLLLSVSIFSFMFSYSSLFSSPSMITYSQTLMNHCYFPLESFQMNKNCIFLICNALLFLVAKTSGFVVTGFDVNYTTDELSKRVGDRVPDHSDAVEIVESELIFSEKNVILLHEIGEKEEEEEENYNIVEKEIECVSENTKEVSIFIGESDDEEEEGGENDENEPSKSRLIFYDDNDEGEGEGEEEEDRCDDDDEGEGEGEEEEDRYDDEIEMLSTEELNQKFEDFIRRMKEEIRVNSEAAGNQLIKASY